MNARHLLHQSAIALLVGSASCAASAQTYAVTDLGVVTGASSSAPNAINDAGGNIRVVGYTRDSKGNWYHGFYWDASSGIVDVGVLLTGGTSNAVAVNSRGEVAGWSGNSAGENSVAVYRNVAGRGALTQLPYPSLTYDGAGPFVDGAHVVGSQAGAINSAGVVTGWVYRQDLGALPVYWLNDPAAGWKCSYFPKLSGSLLTNQSGAPAIDSSSNAAGFVGSANATVPGGGYRAVYWANQNLDASGNQIASAPVYGAPSDAGLPSDNGDYSQGLADWSMSACSFLNSSGVTAGTYGQSGGRFLWTTGHSSLTFSGALNGLSDANGAGISGATGRYSNPSGAGHAYIADTNGGFQDLGVLSGGNSSQGNGIAVVSGSFQVVGWSSVKGGTNHASLWSSGTLSDLNNMTTGLGAFSILSSADRITNAGNIAAQGITKKGGYTHAALLKRQ